MPDKLTDAEIEEIAFIFGNGVDEEPWAEMESHYDPEQRSDPPGWNVYVADGQLFAVFPGGDDWASGEGQAERAAKACCKVAQAIRQLVRSTADLADAVWPEQAYDKSGD